jgi:signal transduction histidine kinase
MAGWYGFWALHRGIWDLRMAHVLVYFAGAATLWVLLEQLHEAYFLLAFAAYPQVFAFLPSPRSAIRGAVVLTGLLLVLTVTESGRLPWLTVVVAVLSVGVGTAMTLFVDAIMRESQQRHRLIAELEATRRELAVAEREAGVLEERQRLAREIHDTLAQGFTSIVMLLEAADAQLGANDGAARAHLDQARRTARESLAEARGVVWALQPPALEQATLAEALGCLAEHLRDETGVMARSVVTGTPRALAPQADAALLRAAQEGLANIRRHAGATEVVLTLSYVGDRVILDIRDDGRGFDPAMTVTAQDGTGLGLGGMRARMADLGGTLTVESTPGEGTTLVAEVPASGGGQTMVAPPERP